MGDHITSMAHETVSTLIVQCGPEQGGGQSQRREYKYTYNQ